MAAPFATATSGLNSLPVEPTVYSCTCGDIHCAGTSIARCTLPLVEYMRRHHQCPCTCACHGVHRAGISSVYAAPVQVLEYFAPAPVAYYALLRLQEVVSILSLSCPPSTLSRVVEYITPAPAVLLHQILASKKLGKGHVAEISLVNSVSQKDTCLVDLGACIWHLSSCVSTGGMVVPTSQLKSNVLLLFGCMFCLVALSGQFSRILAHRLSLR